MERSAAAIDRPMPECAWPSTCSLLTMPPVLQFSLRQTIVLRAFASAICLVIIAARAEDTRTAESKSPPARKQYRTAQLVYLDITTDKTGAVARVDFLNKVPDDVQNWIRSEIMGRHFCVANHSYRRVVE
jgi:hypothetical protein